MACDCRKCVSRSIDKNRCFQPVLLPVIAISQDRCLEMTITQLFSELRGSGDRERPRIIIGIRIDRALHQHVTITLEFCIE